MSGENKIREIIKGLLRLAMDKGATEAERETSLAKARELMAKYAIAIEEGEEHDEAVIRGEWVMGDWTERWHEFAVNAVAMLYACRVVTGVGRADGRRSTKSAGAFRFVGTATDIEAAEETMRWVFDQIEASYKETLANLKQLPEWASMDESARKWLRGNVRKTFKAAAAERLFERASAIMEALNGKTMQLEHDTSRAVAIVDARFAAADNLLKDHKAVSIRAHRPGFGTIAGQRAGDRIELNRGVAAQALQLEHKQD